MRLHGYSRSRIQRLIRDGLVTRAGRALKAASRVHLSDIVIIRYPRRAEEPARHDTLEVLHEDARTLVVNKPGDILSHPTDKIFANAATTILAGQFPGARLHLVHRLDRETSGTLLFAKDAEAASFLAGQFAGRSTEKEYLAVVRGRAAFKRQSVDAPIGREGGKIRIRQAVNGFEAQSAVTDFERLAQGEDFSVVRAKPHTGRLHQIRVHLAFLGHPVLGDKLYCGDGAEYMKAVEKSLQPADFERLGATRQLLHARRLRLKHPDGGDLEAVAPLPADFAPFVGAGRSALKL